MSMGGCNCGEYSLLKEISFSYGSCNGPTSSNTQVNGYCLCINANLQYRYVADNFKSKGFEANSFASETGCGILGPKHLLEDFHIFSSSDVNGIPAGNYLEDQINIVGIENVDSLVSYYNRSFGDFELNNITTEITGPHTDSLLTFTFQFVFSHGNFEKTTDLITWNP